MNKGALLLPNFIPIKTPPGERLIFEMLKEDPGAKDWIVLHSLDLAQHVKNTKGEADFVILAPDLGIVVLEVKSHLSVRYDGYGWWFGGESKPDLRGPFKQASEAMHSILKFLKERKINTNVPMISAAAFTHTPFLQKSAEWHSWQVMDKQSIHARSISANIRIIIENANKLYSSKGLSFAKKPNSGDKSMRGIAQVLRPRFEVIASPAAKRKELEESLLQCTEQQFHFLDLTQRNPRILSPGLAGTGKTTLAVEAARRTKEIEPDASVALFCFNNLLGKKLQSDTEVFDTRIRSGTFHQWMLEIVDPNWLMSQKARDDKFFNVTLPDKVIESLTSPGVKSEVLDLLILDEAQDLFRDRYLDIFNLILKGGLKKGKWLIFGDFEKQDIFGQDKVPVDSFCQDYAEERCAIYPLDINCRNTQEIARTVILLANIDPSYSDVLREDTRHDPVFIFYENEDEQLDLCINAMDSLIGDGFKPKDMVLLSPLDSKALSRKLQMHPRWKGRISMYGKDAKSASFATIHKFKGLEAPAVILTDIEKLSDKARWDLLYVGMSRALHRLVILANEQTKPQFIESLG